MRGVRALVFLAVFVFFLLVTIAVPDIPLGKQIYWTLFYQTDYTFTILGVSATSLIKAIFNGVVYGIIAWLIFTFGLMAMRKEPQPQQPAQPQQKKTA